MGTEWEDPPRPMEDRDEWLFTWRGLVLLLLTCLPIAIVMLVALF